MKWRQKETTSPDVLQIYRIIVEYNWYHMTAHFPDMCQAIN
jgi:hypothetical protein